MGVCQGQLRISLFKHKFGKKLVFNYCLHVWELMNYDNNSDSWCLKNKVHFETNSYTMPYVLAFNPTNADIVYLLHADHIYECNLTNFNFKKQVGRFPYQLQHQCPFFETEFVKYQSFPLVHPAWPTPLGEA